jgi:hypothetical protein
MKLLKLIFCFALAFINHMELIGQTNPVYDVFLFIGQSNMAGRPPIEDQDMGIVANAYLLNVNGQFEPAQNLSTEPNFNNRFTGFNRYSNVETTGREWLAPAYTFCKAVARFNTLPVGAIVNAKGGSSIGSWQKGQVNYDNTVNRVIQALQAYPGSKLRAVFFLGGESDRYSPENEDAPGNNYTAFTAKFNSMATNMRADFSGYYEGDLPFVATKLGKWPPNSPNDPVAPGSPVDDLTHINRVIQRLPLSVPNTYVVSSNGCKKWKTPLSPGDRFHFDGPSVRKLGYRMADTYLRIKKRGFSGTTTWTGTNNKALSVSGTALITSYIPPASNPANLVGMYTYSISNGETPSNQCGGIKAQISNSVAVPEESNNFFPHGINPIIDNPNINGVSISVFRYFSGQVGGTRKGHLLLGNYTTETNGGNFTCKSWGLMYGDELQDFDEDSKMHTTNMMNNLDLYESPGNLESFNSVPVIIEIFIRNATLESINIPGIGILTPADIINSNGSVLHMMQEEETALLQANPKVYNINDTQASEHNNLLIAEPLIYPNPSTGDLYIKWNLPNAVPKNIHLTVFDAQGKMIMNYPNLDLILGTPTITESDFQNKCNCTSGVFFVKFKHDDTIFTKKLILQ